MGLWEYDEKTGSYQAVVWGDMLLSEKKLMELVEGAKDGTKKD